MQIRWLRHTPANGEGNVHQPALAVNVLTAILQTQGLPAPLLADMTGDLKGVHWNGKVSYRVLVFA